IKNPRSVLEVGDEVEVVVSEVDPDKRRLSLSLRATEPNPWEEVAEKYQVGSKIRGTVRNLTDFGAFVEIVPGVDGLVHISDMSWTRRISHPSEVVQKGQEVDAIISAIDVVNQRISLSMKDLLPNEWEEYANTHGVGDVVSGKVTNITDFGVFIELAPGVEGLCHVSEIDRGSGLELNEMFSQGQAVRCRILRIDWNVNRIGLSLHGVDQEGADEELATTTETGGASDTAMAAALKASGLVAEPVGEAEPETVEAAPEETEPEEQAAASELEEQAAASEPEEVAASEPEEETSEAAPEEAPAEEAAASEETAEVVEEAAPAVEEPAVEQTAEPEVVEAEESSEPEESEATVATEVEEAEGERKEPAAEAETESAAGAEEADGEVKDSDVTEQG
ncbi:MAG TPA: S1 RNA-binding domain-containing protein, partial [Acidobacteria bacterium]|nr:S1 RNA-binding domain-containing protein [Acidobacteriota bacterium]